MDPNNPSGAAAPQQPAGQAATTAPAAAAQQTQTASPSLRDSVTSQMASAGGQQSAAGSQQAAAVQQQPAAGGQQPATAAASAASGTPAQSAFNQQGQQAQPGQQTDQQSFAWASDFAKFLGVDQSQYPDPKSFLEAAKAQIGMSTKLERELMAMRQQMPYYNTWMAGQSLPAQAIQQQQAAASQGQQAAQQEKLWDAPEWDPTWETKLVRDENGNIVPRNPIDAPIAAKFTSFIEHRNKVLNDLARDPMSVLGKLMDKRIEEMATRQIEARIEAMQAEQKAKEIVAANEKWLVRTNPLTGQREYTEEGAEYAKNLQVYLDAGLPQELADKAAKNAAMVAIIARQQGGQTAPTALPPAFQQQAAPAAPNPFSWSAPAPMQAAPAVPQNAFNTAATPMQVAGQQGAERVVSLRDNVRQQLVASGYQPRLFG